MDASSTSFMFNPESSSTVIIQQSNQNKKELPSQLWSLQINPGQIIEMGNACATAAFHNQLLWELI